MYVFMYVGAAGNANLQFVFVSACHSREIGDTFIKAGIRHVVCVRIESKVELHMLTYSYCQSCMYICMYVCV